MAGEACCDLLFRPGVAVAISRHFSKRKLTQLIELLTCFERTGGRRLSLLVTGDSEIRRLNKRYRRKDKATDVLSFPINRTSRFSPDSLGDLVISWETTVRQAKVYQVTIREEFLRLLIHGFLHLCGYDHENVSKSEMLRMQRREAIIWNRLRHRL